MKLYKLTTADFKTRAGKANETLWGEGVEHTAPGGELCTDRVLHAYLSPELAVLLNPIHANITNPTLWECDGDVCAADGQRKVGCTRLRTLRQIPLPTVTPEQRVRFAIACARAVLPREACPVWHAWADSYEAGDAGARTVVAARAATRAATRASRAVAHPAAAVWAAAVWASAAAGAASVAEAEAAAAAAEAEAAAAAVWASEAAAEGSVLDLVSIARRAIAELDGNKTRHDGAVQVEFQGSSD